MTTNLSRVVIYNRKMFIRLTTAVDAAVLTEGLLATHCLTVVKIQSSIPLLFTVLIEK